mmetsp:Transcript_948/g.3505  ORF Transcript_948/g.3505 Transcript_948/m.3505 type:complete len:389 (+) Transcript_948:1522-2688(+)
MRIQVENLVALTLEVLKVGRYLSLLPASGCDEVVDILLTLRHALHVLIQRDLRVPRLVVAVGLDGFGARLKAQQRGQRVLIHVGLIAADTLLEEHAHLAVPLDVLLGLLLGALAQELEHPLGDDVAQPADQVAVLEGLARYVQGHILAVDHAPDPAHELGQQPSRILLDQHSAAVQAQTALVALELPPREPSLGVVRGRKQKRSDGERRVGGKVQPERGSVDGAAHKPVERGGVLVAHLTRALGPQRVDGVCPLSVQRDGEAHECAVLLEHRLDRPLRRRQGLVLLLDVEHDPRPPRGCLTVAVSHLARRDGVRPVARAAPPVRQPVTRARVHVNLVRHHEGGVEPDAKLADYVRRRGAGGGGLVVFGVTGNLVDERLGPGPRDGSQV